MIADSSSYVPISHDYDDEIIARVKSNFEALGYVYEPDPETNRPDALVLVAAAASNSTYIYYDWWYYWGWYYPYYPGWGWYYPPSVSVVSYDQGTLFISMVDVRDPPPAGEKVPMVWGAAIRGLLEKTKLSLSDIDLFEINEAFSAQYLAVEKDLGLDRNMVNVNGGAIALGHPLGATGTRLLLTLGRELAARKKTYGIASACIGGGQGIAIIVESFQ